MDRRVFICHVCGVETKRFADHLAAAHGRTDHKKEKVSLCSSSIKFYYVFGQIRRFGEEAQFKPVSALCLAEEYCKISSDILNSLSKLIGNFTPFQTMYTFFG